MDTQTNTKRQESKAQRNVIVDSDKYFPSTETVHQNKSLPSDFKVECQSPELNVFELNYPVYHDSESNSIYREFGTDESIDNNKSEFESLNSLNLLKTDAKKTHSKSLPTEFVDDKKQNHDVKTVKSLVNIPLPKLNNSDFNDNSKTFSDMRHDFELLDLHSARGSANKNEKITSNDDMSNLSKTSIIKCNCKKSKCLRLHCICFSELRECSSMCNCVGCKNNSGFKEIRDFVIEKTKEINPLAFKPKIKTFKGMNVNSRGCNCTKNNCLKKYCECYKSGSNCTKLCGCVLCKNSKETLSNEEITDIRDKGYRRKHKIVITEPTLDKRDTIQGDTAVSFIKHKKKRRNKKNIY